MSVLKKILTLVLVAAITAGVAITGTVAYLTSEDSDVNVMTLGNVKIEQKEQQRVEKDGEFTNELEDFKQGKPLMPVTYPEGRAADDVKIGEYEITLKDNEANYVDKIVTVTNTGKSDAFVRTLVAIPTGGADWEPNPVAANDCWLHWNYPADTIKYWTLTNTATFIEVDGIGYYVWEFVHKEALTADEETYPVIRGFYMDKKVNNDEKGYFMTYDDGTTKRIDDVKLGETVNVLVLSQAVQTAGFADAQTALNEAFPITGENLVKWFGGVKVPEVVDKDNVKDALNEGKDVIFGDDIEIPAEESNGYGKTALKVYKGQTIDGADNTFKALGATGTWDSGITAYGGTIKNLTVGQGFRGIFITHITGDNGEKCGLVTFENVVIDGPVYTFNCDQGTNNGLKAINSTFNGWTSYAATLGDVEFIDCNFGEGAGYSFCRPYAPTTFVDCDFDTGYQIDARAAVTFENCTIGGVALTADNLATLVTDNSDNATVK